MFKPATRTRGGILLLWNSNTIDLQDIIRRFSISAIVSSKDSDISFKLTVVYGPVRDGLKPAFFRELKPEDGHSCWLMLGYLNLIYKARDKNNRNLNRSRMCQFRQALNQCQLNEIHLQNRNYQQQPGTSDLGAARLSPTINLCSSWHLRSSKGSTSHKKIENILSTAEFHLRKGLKRRIMGYAVINRARKKQASRITNLREGDANTNFFFISRIMAAEDETTFSGFSTMPDGRHPMMKRLPLPSHTSQQ